jgi:hypothetical protein
LYCLLFAVGYKFYALNHFFNCHGLPQGLAFALHFPVPRKCLQCAWQERTLDAWLPEQTRRFEMNQKSLRHFAYATLLVALATPHTVWAQAKAAPPI